MGANGSKNRPQNAYPIRCRVSGYYEPCSERVRVCQLKKWRQPKKDGLATSSHRGYSSPPLRMLRKREIFIGNLLVRVLWIIEMIVVERPCAMGL